MKTTPFYLAALIMLISSACTPTYQSRNFDSLTSHHQVVAVLPVEMVYTGMTPEGFSEDDMWEIEMAESQAFQMALHNEILRSTRNGRKSISVSLQDVKTTQALLQESGIALTDVEYHSPEKLAKILGVDAVVRATIQKNRIMSDLSSYGIEMGVRALGILTKQPTWPLLPGGVTHSKEINASYALVDGEHGETLWSVAFDVQADWRQHSNDIIDQVTRRGARKFPYRDQ